MDSFISSEGWNLKNTRLIHLVEPFTVWPMGGGKKTTARRSKDSINKGIEYFWRTEMGVFRTMNPANKPAQIKKVCLKK